MSILSGLSAGSSMGGSISNSWNSAYGYNNGFSNTYGTRASELSKTYADRANAFNSASMGLAMDYNAEQAQLQRDWQEYMANTVYQRTVADMRAAGINPILAANMGLGTASVGSGATASISPISGAMAQAYPDRDSVNTGERWSNGESASKSWQESTSGLAEGLKQMGTIIAGALSALNAGSQVSIAIDGLNKTIETMNQEGTASDGTKASRIEEIMDNPLSIVNNVPILKDLPLIRNLKKRHQLIEGYKEGQDLFSYYDKKNN